jgi:small subunit ribosomal protein S7
MINRLMKKGKKSISIRILYDALDLIEERAKRPALEVFEEAVQNVTPTLEVKPRRVGGATYQVPVEVRPSRRTALAMRWILGAATARPGKSMAERTLPKYWHHRTYRCRKDDDDRTGFILYRPDASSWFG